LIRQRQLLKQPAQLSQSSNSVYWKDPRPHGWGSFSLPLFFTSSQLNNAYMKTPNWLKVLVAIATLWNLFVVISVVFNSSFVLSRAAGGQFTTFPVGIRVTYLGTTMILILQAVTLVQMWQGYAIRPTWLPKAFFLMSAVSAFVNLLSRSQNERWNGFPAALVAYAFWIAGVRRAGITPDSGSR